MNNQRPYLSEEIEFLKLHVPGSSFRKLTDMFNNKFDVKRTYQSIKSFCIKHGIKNGIDMRYSHENKNPYAFSSDANTNYDLGCERVDYYGFIKVKVARPNVWKLKHHLVWEKHLGKIPENSVVLFADGNNRNFTPENLVLLARNEFSWLIGKKMFPEDNELMKNAALLAKLAIKTRKMRGNIQNV